ncbi:hypothetical protein [Actinomadura logoneensis]|uniref:hypothetical protein n=1 Tax=Actinomadura logoneensis TaxID=2293572 RepID=UPI001314983B|nr:hypothetical protein [Actinomadura logoneensis]
MPAKKYVAWAAAAVAVAYLVQRPDGAARAVARVATGLTSAADSVATFLDALG